MYIWLYYELDIIYIYIKLCNNNIHNIAAVFTSCFTKRSRHSLHQLHDFTEVIGKLSLCSNWFSSWSWVVTDAWKWPFKQDGSAWYILYILIIYTYYTLYIYIYIYCIYIYVKNYILYFCDYVCTYVWIYFMYNYVIILYIYICIHIWLCMYMCIDTVYIYNYII